jgi:hypothetical protein
MKLRTTAFIEFPSSLVYVPKRDERKDKEYPSMSMARAPQILPQRIRHVLRIRGEHSRERHSAVHHGRQDDQQDTSCTL